MSNIEKKRQMPVKYSMHALLHVLKERSADEDNPISRQDALTGVREYLEAHEHLDDYDFTLNNAGRIRWENNVECYFTELRKGDFAHRERGQWWITEKGIELAEEEPDRVREIAGWAYQEWKEKHKSKSDTIKVPEDDSELGEDVYDPQSILDDAQGKARFGIEERLKQIDEYDFQNLVADILTATGLTVQEIAPPGPDGGIDITATKDVLGIERLRVQVKHWLPSGGKVPPNVVQQMRGTIDQSTETGMVVSSSGFTKEAKKNAEEKAPRIKLIDLIELLDLLDKYYEKLPARGQQLLPLQKVYFSKPDDE